MARQDQCRESNGELKCRYQIAIHDPILKPGRDLFYSKGESKPGERREEHEHVACCTQPCTSQINPHHIRDGWDMLWAPFFVTHTHSAYLDTGAGCEPTSLPLYQDDPHLTLWLSPGHCSMMSLMPPMSPSRCLHVDLIRVSVWLPVKLCTPVHCTCQFSLSFTRWAQVLTLTGTGPGPWPVYIRRRPPHVLCTNAGLEKIEEDKK